MSSEMSDSDLKEGTTNPFEEEESSERSTTSFDDESTITDTVAEENHNHMMHHILKRGALISGVVPSEDDEERMPPAGSEDVNDLESGIYPPDSDYASRAPKSSIWAPSIGDNSMGPSPSNLPMEEDDSISSKRSKSFRFLALGFISLLLVGAIIAVAVVVAGAGGGSGSREIGSVTGGGGGDDTGNGGGIDTGSNGGGVDTGSNGGGVDTNAGTGNPPPDMPPLTNRQQLLHDIVVGVSGGAILQDTTSPQSQARNWLLYEDTMWLSPSTSFTSERITQRYVLAIFYYATNGPNSWKDNNWMGGDECDGDFWDGISCNENDEIRAIAFGKSRRKHSPKLISGLHLFANTIHALRRDRRSRSYRDNPPGDGSSFLYGKLDHKA
jgi:hypothetical protein